MSGTAFSKEQYNRIYPDGIGNHYWNHARNRIIRRFLQRHGLTGGRIMEIGCGRGLVLDFLRKRKFQCFGVELGDADPVPACRDFIYTNTNAFELPSEICQDIDTVLLLDVLEHLEDPAAFIGEIRRKYSAARHLVVTVPARQELWTNYDTFNRHFRRYNLAELKALAGEGKRMREACYFNHILYPVFWVYAKFIKKRGTYIKAPKGIMVGLHAILSLVLQADFRIFPGYLRGTSLIAVFALSEG